MRERGTSSRSRVTDPSHPSAPAGGRPGDAGRGAAAAPPAPAAAEPNAEQVRYWNEQAGPRWVAMQEPLDLQLGVLGERVMDRVAIARGERVLDVGCGCGHTTLALARRVGEAGQVLGIDLSAVMLARARSLAEAAGLSQVGFVQADAQTHAFPAARFDVLYSRFGTMFFADPVRAFANLATALRPGGRLGFVCWRALAENPWMLVPLTAALAHLPPPPMPKPDEPGPFAFADAERVRGLLARAGFEAIALERLDETLTVGGGSALDRTVEFLLHIGPVAAALRDADPALATTVAQAVHRALAPHATAAGVRLASAAWLVSARRP